MKYIGHRNGVWKRCSVHRNGDIPQWRESECKGYEYVYNAQLPWVEGMECDVRLTLDGRLVIHHDALYWSRQRGEWLNIQENVYDNEMQDQMDLLEDLLEMWICQEPSILSLYIELKDTGSEYRLFQLLQKYDLLQESTCCLISFHTLSLERCRDLRTHFDAKVRLGQNLEAPSWSSYFSCGHVELWPDADVYNWEWKWFLWNYGVLWKQWRNGYHKIHNVFTINSRWMKAFFQRFSLCHALFTDCVESVPSI